MGVRYDENFAYFEDSKRTMEGGDVFKLEDLKKAADEVVKKSSGHYDTFPDIPRLSLTPDMIHSRQVAMVILAMWDMNKKIEKLEEKINQVLSSVGMVT